jgi:hypothetical protein
VIDPVRHNQNELMNEEVSIDSGNGKLTWRTRDSRIVIADGLPKARISAGNWEPIGLVSPMDDVKIERIK